MSEKLYNHEREQRQILLDRMNAACKRLNDMFQLLEIYPSQRLFLKEEIAGIKTDLEYMKKRLDDPGVLPIQTLPIKDAVKILNQKEHRGYFYGDGIGNIGSENAPDYSDFDIIAIAEKYKRQDEG